MNVVAILSPTQPPPLLSSGETFAGHPIFLTPLLWNSLNDIPLKVSHYEDFSKRLGCLVAATKFHIQRLATCKKEVTFSILMLVGKDQSERQVVRAKVIETSDSKPIVLIMLAREHAPLF